MKPFAGVEADDCFYIQNEARIRGKKRLDLTVDPAPDLAIEIDITSRTRFNNYEALGVPELWRYNGQSLKINVLESGKYVKSNISRNFPQFSLIDAIPQYVEQSKVVGRNVAMKAFRNWVREQIASMLVSLILFYGSIKLDALRLRRNAGQIADEVIQHSRG